jgi:branched-chain amino acid transport system substrate-binding protein
MTTLNGRWGWARVSGGRAGRNGGRRSRRGRVAFAVTASVATLLAGCASDSGGGDAAPPGNASVSGEPYRIGNLTHQNTTFAQLPKANIETQVAWEKWTNAHGGINGHPVDLTTYDTQSDNAKGVVFAKRLVEDDNVIALAGDNDPTSEPAYQDYLTQQGIPVVGSAHSTAAYENPNWFPTAATDYAVLSPSVVDAAVAAGVKNYGLIYCTESPLCKSDVDAQATAAAAKGLNVAANFSASLAAPNYTAECVKLKEANVDGVYFSATAAAIAKLATDCKRQGMSLRYFFLEPSPDIQQTPAIYENGAYGISVAMPYWADVAANQDFLDAMDQYAPDADPTSDGAQIWAGLEVLKAALEKVPNDPMTPETVKKGLYALGADFDTGGLTVPLTYTDGQPTHVNCVFQWTLGTDGQYELSNDGKPSCTG